MAQARRNVYVRWRACLCRYSRPRSAVEAQDIVTRVLGKHFGKPLAHAFWSAQRESYGENSIRRPYVVTGVYPQTHRGQVSDLPHHIMRQLENGLKRRSDHPYKDAA